MFFENCLLLFSCEFNAFIQWQIYLRCDTFNEKIAIFLKIFFEGMK